MNLIGEGNMINKLKKNYNKLIYALLIICIINVLIYIFKGARVWLNADSTFLVDYSIEQIRTRSIFPAEWFHCNDFWIYSLIPLMTVFIKLGVSLFLSRQFSVFIQSILLILILVDLYKNCLNDKKGLLITLLLILSGVSGQFIFEIFGDATYGTIVFYMLLELWLYYKYLKTSKKRYVIFYGIILCFITACSLRFPIYIGAPIICCLLYKCYDEKISKGSIWFFITTVLSILIGFILNKYLSSVLLINTNYGELTLVRDNKELVANIKSALFDYFSAMGATGRSVLSLNRTYYINYNTSSPLVVLSFIKYIYAIVTVCIPFLLIKKIKNMSSLEKTLYIYVSSFAFIMVFFLLIGNMAWWPRYVVPIVFFLILLYPLFYKYFFFTKKNKKIVFNIFIVLFSITSLVLSSSSYFDFSNGKFMGSYYDGLADYLMSKDLSFGYAITSNEANIYRTLTNGKLHVLPLDATAKYLVAWGTSRDWYRNDYYSGKAFIMRQKSQPSTEIEKKAIETYEYADFIIFVFESNTDIIDNLY